MLGSFLIGFLLFRVLCLGPPIFGSPQIFRHEAARPLSPKPYVRPEDPINSIA